MDDVEEVLQAEEEKDEKQPTLNESNSNKTNNNATQQSIEYLKEIENAELKRNRQKKSKEAAFKRTKSWRDVTAEELLAQEKEGPYIWDPKHCGRNIVVIFDTPSIAIRKPASRCTDAIRGCHGYLIGYHVFQFEFNDKPWGSHCMVGVCTRKTALEKDDYCHLIGADKYSWGWDVPSRTLYHNGESQGCFPKNPELDFVPRSFSMIVDLFNGILSFDFGEERIEEAFTDLKVGKHHLFPVASLVYGFSAIRIEKESVKPLNNQLELIVTDDRIDEEEGSEASALTAKEPNDSMKAEIPGGEDVNRNFDDQVIVEELDDIGEEVLSLNRSDDTDPQGQAREPIDLDLYPSSEATDSLSVTEAKPMLYTYERPVLPQHMSNLSAMSYASYVVAEPIEEEPPDVVYSNVSELSEQDSEIVKFMHGWDSTKRGALLQPYPNCPTICVPAPSLNGKVQSIRCKEGFLANEGRHTWQIREIRMYPPAIVLYEEGCHLESAQNDVIIGVASSEYRSFNHGFSLNQLGSHAWGFEPSTKLLWHGDFFHESDEGHIASDLEIDLTEGILLELDTHQQTLTFSYQGRYLCSFSEVKGDILFPLLHYNQGAYYPIEIEYIRGPSKHIRSLISDAWLLTPSEVQEKIYNRRCMWKRSLSFIRSQKKMNLIKSAYRWGDTSANAQISFISKNQFHTHSSVASLAVAECPLSGGRHQILFTFDPMPSASCWAIGLVSRTSRLLTESTQDCSTPYRFGGDMHSWLWDLHQWCLYHAGRKLGIYPTVSGFEIREYSKYKLTIDFGNLGYNSVSFSAISTSGQEVDLGIAFVNMAPVLYPCVAIASCAGQKQTVKMEYLSGPWSPTNRGHAMSVSAPTVTQSRTCAIL